MTERRVDEPEQLAELLRQLRRAMALPRIFVDGHHIGNDDDLRVRLAGGRAPFDV